MKRLQNFKTSDESRIRASAGSCIARTLLICLLSASMLFAVSCKQRQVSTPSQATSSPSPITPSPKATSSPQVNTYHGTGVVTKIVTENPHDKTLASIELDHGEIVGLMPAMRMEFFVKQKSLLDGVKVGDMVDFAIEEKGGTEIISEIKKH